MTLCSFRQAQDKLTRQYQARTWHQGFRISPKFGSPRDGEGDTKGLKGIRQNGVHAMAHGTRAASALFHTPFIAQVLESW